MRNHALSKVEHGHAPQVRHPVEVLYALTILYLYGKLNSQKSLAGK